MYYVNGKYVKEEDAKISVLDLSILRGFGVFDYLRTYNGRPFHLHDHLERLKYSCEHIGLPLSYTFEQIEEIVHNVQKFSNLFEASIKILVTGGVSADQFTPFIPTNLIVFAYPLTSYPSQYYTDGIKVITTRLNRSLPTSKTTQYTPAIVAMQQGKAQDAKEALYINASDEILEATTSNFFAFKNNTLFTCCSDEVLIGITREVVLQAGNSPFPHQYPRSNAPRNHRNGRSFHHRQQQRSDARHSDRLDPNRRRQSRPSDQTNHSALQGIHPKPRLAPPRNPPLYNKKPPFRGPFLKKNCFYVDIHSLVW